MCYIFTFSSFPTREREREREQGPKRTMQIKTKQEEKQPPLYILAIYSHPTKNKRCPPPDLQIPSFSIRLDRKKWEVQAKSSVIFKIFPEVIQWSGTIIHRDITSSFGFGLSSAHIPPFVLKVYRSSTTLENRSTKL